METQHTPIEIFCSCSDSPDDASLLEQLERHLSVLRQEGAISTWNKRQIAAGSDWQIELDRHLDTASLILLLISPDFLASDYQYGVELQRAMERHDANEARVIPILLRPCDWENAPFGKLQVVPRNGMPLTLWHNYDAGFTEIAKEIRATLQTLLSSPFNSPTSKRTLWNVPHQRNPYFTGRDELFDQLNQYLAPIRQKASVESHRVALTQPHAITGLGGIGKTQIAVEYAYRSRDLSRYTHTLWINAASSETIIAGFVSIAKLLPSLAVHDKTNQHKLAEAVKYWLEQCQEPWLLIFDNADEVALARNYLPQSSNGNILLTTRAHAVGSLAMSLAVETMGLVEGTKLLLRRAQRFTHASDDEFNQASNIVVALDHFPLALDQAGAYIEETQCSFVEYLQMYQIHRKDFLTRRGLQATNYPDSVATTWSLSFQRVEQANPSAAELLRLCAFLSPDMIPEELIRGGSAYWPPSLQKAVSDPFIFNPMITELLKFSLVKRQIDTQCLSVHRLVQAVQRDAMKPEIQQQWAQRVIRAVNRVFPQQVKDPATWPQCLRYLDQAQECERLIEHYGLYSMEGADILNRTGLYFFEQALYTIAGSLFQRTLEIQKRWLGNRHPDIALSLSNLAVISNLQGNYQEAEIFYQRALTIQEQTLEHTDLAIALTCSNLASLYEGLRRYPEAELLLRRTLEIREQQLGQIHPDRADSLQRLAKLCWRQGKWGEAESHYRSGLAIYEHVRGLTHVDTAICVNNLAVLYFDMGEYEQAEQFNLRAFSLFKQVYGPTHPQLASNLHNRATIYRNQGRYEEAESLYREAISIWEQVYGPVAPSAASSLHSLAELYRLQKRYKEAESLYREAISIWEQVYGRNYLDIARSFHGLARLYRAIKDVSQATQAYQQAILIRRQTLEPTHPEMLSVLEDYHAFLRETN